MLAKRRTHRDGPHGDTPEKVVRAFVRRINRRDVEGLTQLMTDNHVLIDSLGHRIPGGRPAMNAAWTGYFQMVPEYQISAKAIFRRGNTVILVGTASGNYRVSTTTDSVGTWRTPATWRAVVRRGRIAEWQVYADNEPIRELMRRATETAV